MDGKNSFRLGFESGQRFAKHFRRNYLLFYAGFVEGLRSSGPDKSHIGNSKYHRRQKARKK